MYRFSDKHNISIHKANFNTQVSTYIQISDFQKKVIEKIAIEFSISRSK